MQDISPSWAGYQRSFIDLQNQKGTDMNTEQKNEFNRLFQELDKLKQDFVDNPTTARWQQAERARRAFRICGIVIIMCSIGIPFVSILSAETFPLKQVVISFLGLTIAALTSLTSFFSWAEEWRVQRDTHRALVHSTSIWHLKIVEASHMEDYESGKKAAIAATQELFDTTGTRLASLWTEYFKGVKQPTG